jgi:predicted RNA binding protein YcfA (HicA-like mRNA interferase family)
MEEEVENLDELSRKALGNYTTAAALNLSKVSQNIGGELAKSNYSDNPEHKKYDYFKDPDKRKMLKRVSGITKASMRLSTVNDKRITKEEAEQLDEMPESSMKTRDVHAHLKSKGWAVARTSGGHDIYKHPKAKNIIAVPRHKQLKAPLIKGILKSSQVSEEVVEESFRIGGMGSRGGDRNYLYVRPEPKDGSELENIPSRPKTELQKRLKAALADVGEKLKQTHPKLKEALGDDITVFKKGSNVKQKIKASSYGAFKFHGFRKVAEAKDSQEYDYEGDMAKSDLRSIMHHAKELHDMIEDTTNLAEWCQSKITLAEDYLSTVANYMRSEMNEGAVPSKEETTKVRHHKSGKELVVTKRSVERYKQQGYHPVKEEVELDEGRASQRHPLEGHEYHKKSNEALVHIAKDAHAAAEAMKGHNTDSENKYRDQANDSATVRHFRQKNGMPDWYKKKYGHVNEEVMSEDENDYRRKIEKNNKRFVAATKRQQNPLTNVHTAKEIEKKMQQKPVKESASEPTEGEMKGKQQMSRRAQIVKNAAKGTKMNSLDTFQKDPELSSEIHKT